MWGCKAKEEESRTLLQLCQVKEQEKTEVNGQSSRGPCVVGCRTPTSTGTTQETKGSP